MEWNPPREIIMFIFNKKVGLFLKNQIEVCLWFSQKLSIFWESGLLQLVLKSLGRRFSPIKFFANKHNEKSVLSLSVAVFWRLNGEKNSSVDLSNCSIGRIGLMALLFEKVWWFCFMWQQFLNRKLLGFLSFINQYICFTINVLHDQNGQKNSNKKYHFPKSELPKNKRNCISKQKCLMLWSHHFQQLKSKEHF